MFSVFLSAIVFFHISEFLLAFYFTREEFGLRSLLISKVYIYAMLFACSEYFIEKTFFPLLHSIGIIQFFGLILVILGEIIRITAIVTAKHNFTHLIKHVKRENHVLIKHGIYRLVRHPGYMGWFIWCVGTQILLTNPVSTVLFAVVAWKFFADRIEYEEYFLQEFFGQEYLKYSASVPSGIPFIL